MKRYILLVVLGFALLNSCSKKNLILTEEEKNWLKENKDLKVALYGYYPPYQFEKGNGEIDGIFIDYLALIESKIDYKFTRVKYEEWSNLIEDSKTGKIDLILEIQKTEERSKFLNFYSDIFNSRQMIVTRKENANLITFDNISEYSLVLPKGYSIAEDMRKQFPDMEINYEIDGAACLKAISEGKYDTYIGPKANSYYYIKKFDIKDLVVSDVASIHNYNPSVAVPKKNIILSKIIKKVDRSISFDEKETIFNNWLLKKALPIYYKLSFWLILLSVIVLLILVIIFHNRRLKIEVKKRTKEIQLALEEVKKSNSYKTSFIQNISHEIKTPMNGVLGYLELLRKDDITTLERDKYVDIIIKSGKNLVNVIDNVLEVSSLQSDEVVVNENVVNLDEVFKNLTSFFNSQAKRKGLNLVYRNQNFNQNDSIIIDKPKLMKILKRIVNNAIKFTSEGLVELSYIKNKNILEIRILDTGIGINSVEKEIIFDSFFQLENKISKKIGGLGLGLTIAKKNALILGGEISFISEESKGSTFFVKLPFKQIDLSKGLKKPICKIEEKSTYQILIAEDEEINFLLVNSILSKFKPYDFLVTRAKNGQEAVTICEENKNIDLVLMDIRMPIMDGYEATEILKKMRPNLPIIAHTAYSTEKDVLSAYHAGCDNVLSKPININEFKQTILNYIKIASA